MTLVYGAFDDRVYRWTLTGESEVDRRRIDGHRYLSLAVDESDPDRLVFGTVDAGLLYTADGGETTTAAEGVSYEAAEGVSYDRVSALAWSPHDSDVVYAGTEPSHLYRSSDGGETWTAVGAIQDLPSEPEWSFPPRPHTHHVRWIEVDPFDPDRLLVGIEAGALLVTEDGGETWIERPEGSRRDIHSLTAHPEREGRVFAAAGDGFAQSDDGGLTWTHPQDGLDHRYCWSVVTNPGDPDMVCVSSARSASRAHRPERAESYVYRKRGDEPWERLDDRGLAMGEGTVRAELATGDEPDLVYAMTNRGLFRSTDVGDRWRRVDVEWPDALERQVPRGLVVTG